MAVNVADAKGLTFECQPGCGFCCTASPLVAPHEAPRLPMAIRAPDGNLRIPLAGVACSALQGDRRCGIYDARPAVCHLYPYAIHAGRRVQVTLTLACPGVGAWHPTGERDTEGDPRAHPFGLANHAEDGAARAAELALAQPGAADEAARAKATFAEFDRRMKEWNVAASPDKLRTAFLPHAGTLALPGAIPALFAAIAEGDVLLEGDAARAVAALFDGEADADISDLFSEAAADGFDEPETVLWVEPDFSWTRARAKANAKDRDGRRGEGEGQRAGAVTLTRTLSGASRETTFDVSDLLLDWAPDATDVVARYLARLMHRDHTEGAAAWLVDASGYHATPAAAYARVLGEASVQVALRSSLLAAGDGLATVDAAHARRGVMAYETAFHSLPTLGAIL